jgi:hypothetical protein
MISETDSQLRVRFFIREASNATRRRGRAFSSKRDQALLAGAFLLFALRKEGRVIGFDWTPPPFAESFLRDLRDLGVCAEPRDAGIQFEPGTPTALVVVTRLIKWSDVVPVRVLDLPAGSEAPVPLQRRRFTIRRPLRWYYETLNDVVATAFLSTEPEPGVEIVSSRIRADELLTLFSEVHREMRFNIGTGIVSYTIESPP